MRILPNSTVNTAAQREPTLQYQSLKVIWLCTADTGKSTPSTELLKQIWKQWGRLVPSSIPKTSSCGPWKCVQSIRNVYNACPTDNVFCSTQSCTFHLKILKKDSDIVWLENKFSKDKGSVRLLLYLFLKHHALKRQGWKEEIDYVSKHVMFQIKSIFQNNVFAWVEATEISLFTCFWERFQ